MLFDKRSQNGLSVPDSDMLVKIANVLNVSVNDLLDEDQTSQKIRGKIIFLTILTMIITCIIQDERISIILVSICTFLILFLLARNLSVLTCPMTKDQMKVLKKTTLFNGCVFLVGLIFSVLIGTDIIIISEVQEKLFAMSLVSCVMIFVGMVSTKLPFNRHTGLRLPWTVIDEQTWNLAHKILGMVSFSLVLLYIAGTLTIANFEMVTLWTMIAWIGIPGSISFWFYKKKWYGH